VRDVKTGKSNGRAADYNQAHFLRWGGHVANGQVDIMMQNPMYEALFFHSNSAEGRSQMLTVSSWKAQFEIRIRRDARLLSELHNNSSPRWESLYLEIPGTGDAIYNAYRHSL
jgi:hypothetical protein